MVLTTFVVEESLLLENSHSHSHWVIQMIVIETMAEIHYIGCYQTTYLLQLAFLEL